MSVFLAMPGLTFAFSPVFSAHNVQDLAAIKQQILNIQFEDVVIMPCLDATCQSLLQRPAVLIRKQGAIGTVVMCHGYLGCKRDALALKHLFPQYNIIAFDFRAHGQDRQDQVSTIGRDEALDVMAAVTFVKADPLMRGKPVIAFGFSMGAVSAIQAQGQDNSLFDVMILDCPYDSTDAAMSRGLDEKMKVNLFGMQFTLPGKDFILEHMYDEWPQALTSIMFQSITRLDSNKVNTKFVRVLPIESIRKITVPCLFIHCQNDKKVPVSAVQSLYDNKPGFKRLWITQGKGHFGSYHHYPEMYWYKVNKFLQKLREQGTQGRVEQRICDDRIPTK